MSLKSRIAKAFRESLRKTGWDYVSAGRYGHDVYLDIRRLSALWGKPVNLFFDIGAHDGRTVKYVRDRLGNCRIVAFEPHPGVFADLRRNWSRDKKITFSMDALGAAPGQRTLYEYENSVLHSLVSNSQYTERFRTPVIGEKTVPVTTVDAYCSANGVNFIDVLKVDTEDFDFEVLQGARGMLEAKKVRFVYFEFQSVGPGPKGTHGGSLAEIDAFLIPLGYRLVSIYTDYAVPETDFFSEHNALYVLAP